MDNIADKLRNSNLKATSQRLAILNLVISSYEHPSAETIYLYLKKDYPKISLGTVYKNLKSLKEANLIQEINVGKNINRYDGNTELHPHTICFECEKISDLDSCDNMKTLTNYMLQDADFNVTYSQFYFFGICTMCYTNKK